MLIAAIKSLYPNAVTFRGGEPFDNDGNSVTIDQSLVDAEVIRLQAIEDAQAYARSRATEYPTIQECVHAILDDDLDALQVLRQAVKDKYPK